MATIPGLPEELQQVPGPNDRRGWLLWRKGILAWRTLIHKRCENDPKMRAVQWRLCAEDPAYFLLMFGVLYEPRDTIDIDIDLETGEEFDFVKPPGWYPWVLFSFQVDTIRWFQDCMSRMNDGLGRGDGVDEKSREMGVSWIFCGLASHGWLFLENQTIGMLSHKQEYVDATEDSRTLFFKIRGNIGINEKVPDMSRAEGTFWDGLPTRMPSWMRPPIDARKHDLQLRIVHPTKTNEILGDSTSGKSGIGARFTWMLIDEGAKITNLRAIYDGLQATSYHRFVVSSATLEFGPDFFELATLAREAAENDPPTPGPSYFRTEWWLHPLRDENWLANEKARSQDSIAFEREYGINYHAGAGASVYPYSMQMGLSDTARYEHGAGPVVVSIDPGLRDPTALTWWQSNINKMRYTLFDALLIDVDTSKFLVPMLMGFPHDHPALTVYDGHPRREDFRELAAFMWKMRESGAPVDFVGDPFGDQAGGAERFNTFYRAMHEESVELNKRFPMEGVMPVYVTVHMKYDDGARGHMRRKQALNGILPLIDIHRNTRTPAVLKAIQDMKYSSPDKSKSALNEPSKPIHGWGSHYAATGEYFAVHEEVRQGLSVLSQARRKDTRPRRERAAAPSRKSGNGFTDGQWPGGGIPGTVPVHRR